MGRKTFKLYADDPRTPAELLLSIGRAAAWNGQASREHGEALMTEQTEEEMVLSQAVELVRPVLESVVSKIEKHAQWTSGGAPGKAGDTEWHTVQGVLVVDDFAVYSDTWPGASAAERAKRGRFGGEGLYLLEDGRLAVASRAGTWSRVRGELSARTTSMIVATTSEVVEDFDLLEILEGMLKTLEKQAKGRAEATTRARARAERLRDVLFMLKEEI